MKLARAHNFSIYEHVTFYENVEVGPPTKSNRGPLMKLLRRWWINH